MPWKINLSTIDFTKTIFMKTFEDMNWDSEKNILVVDEYRD